jgi:hypothetical protein
MKCLIFLLLILQSLPLKSKFQKGISYEIGYIVEGMLDLQDINACGHGMPTPLNKDDRNRLGESLYDIIWAVDKFFDHKWIATKFVNFFISPEISGKICKSINRLIRKWQPYINSLQNCPPKDYSVEEKPQMISKKLDSGILAKIMNSINTAVVLQNIKALQDFFTSRSAMEDKKLTTHINETDWEKMISEYPLHIYNPVLFKLKSLEDENFKNLVKLTLENLNDYRKSYEELLNSKAYKKALKLKFANEYDKRFDDKFRMKINLIATKQFGDFNGIFSNLGEWDEEEEKKAIAKLEKDLMADDEIRAKFAGKVKEEVTKEIENEVEASLDEGKIQNLARIALTNFGKLLRIFFSVPLFGPELNDLKNRRKK